MTKESAVEFIRQAIEEINSLREPDKLIPRSGEIRLVGPEGALDSMETVSLVVMLESSLAKSVGRKVELITPEVFTGKSRAFESIESLARHILAACDGSQVSFATSK